MSPLVLWSKDCFVRKTRNGIKKDPLDLHVFLIVLVVHCQHAPVLADGTDIPGGIKKAGGLTVGLAPVEEELYDCLGLTMSHNVSQCIVLTFKCQAEHLRVDSSAPSGTSCICLA